MNRSFKRRAVMATLAGLALSASTWAATLDIDQFRVRGPSGGNDEFVQLTNTASTALDASGYALGGSNASGTTGVRATLPDGTVIQPGCHLLLTNGASNGYSGSVPGDVVYKSGITDTGGLAILDANGSIVDQVGLSDGSAYKAGTPLDSLGSSNTDQGYGRRTNDARLPQNTGDNRADFVVVAPSAPLSSASPCLTLGDSVSIADSTATVHGPADVPMCRCRSPSHCPRRRRPTAA